MRLFPVMWVVAMVVVCGGAVIDKTTERISDRAFGNKQALNLLKNGKSFSCNIVQGSLGRTLCSFSCALEGHAGGYCGMDNTATCQCHDNKGGVPIFDQLACHLECVRHSDGGFMITPIICSCYNYDDEGINTAGVFTPTILSLSPSIIIVVGTIFQKINQY